jgi:transmembrane sensor
MPPAPMEPGAEERLRIDAAAWYVRMRSPVTDEERAEFDAWLGQPGNRVLYERMAVRWLQSDLISKTKVGQEREGLPPRRTGGHRGRHYALAASLVAVIAIGLTLWAWSGDRPRGGGVESGMAATAITSPVGIRQVRLADGSTVTLDTASAIEVQMTEGARRITLVRGRARFEVAHDASRPFIVTAGADEVVALGTIFDVSLNSGSPRVSLLRGSVEVRHAGKGGAPGRVIARLTPGQAIALVGDAPAVQTAPPAEAIWTKGMLAFDGVPLADVLAAANRYSARKVSIDDPALGTLRVTGTFHADRPDELAATLAAAFGLEVVRRGDGYLLRRPAS